MSDLIQNNQLLQDVCGIVETSKQRVASRVNSTLTLMYWHIGKRINEDVFNNRRADYGKQTVATLSSQLQELYGAKEFSVRSIRRMMQFAQEFPDVQIVSPVATQLQNSTQLRVFSSRTTTRKR